MKKIESHLHRRALQADLQQSNAYKPCSEKSKKMIRDMGNVELFELCETIHKCNAQNALLLEFGSSQMVACPLVVNGVELVSSRF